MTPELVLTGARFVHLAAAMLAFGAAVFPLYARTRAHFPMRVAAIVALASGLLWFGCVMADVTGDPSSALAPDQVALVLFQTGFGQAWAVHLLASVLFVAAALTGSAMLIATLATASLVSLAGIGHAAAGEGIAHLVRLGMQAAHLCACGLWLGALIPLWAALRLTPIEGRSGLVERFKWAGYAAVVLALLSGVANTALVMGSLLPDAASRYGQILIVKIALVAVLVLIALINQFRSTLRRAWSDLMRGIAAELVIFAAVLLAVSWLGLVPPMTM